MAEPVLKASIRDDDQQACCCKAPFWCFTTTAWTVEGPFPKEPCDLSILEQLLLRGSAQTLWQYGCSKMACVLPRYAILIETVFPLFEACTSVWNARTRTCNTTGPLWIYGQSSQMKQVLLRALWTTLQGRNVPPVMFCDRQADVLLRVAPADPRSGRHHHLASANLWQVC